MIYMSDYYLPEYLIWLTMPPDGPAVCGRGRSDCEINPIVRRGFKKTVSFEYTNRHHA
jgi:hypothetical protein